jgi:hypothetical protein
MARRGDPEADHALRFRRDPSRPRGAVCTATGRGSDWPVVEIAYNGIKRQVRVDGRVIAESPLSDNGWWGAGHSRETPRTFMAAKQPGVGLKAGPEEPPSVPVPAPLLSAAAASTNS